MYIISHSQDRPYTLDWKIAAILTDSLDASLKETTLSAKYYTKFTNAVFTAAS